MILTQCSNGRGTPGDLGRALAGSSPRGAALHTETHNQRDEPHVQLAHHSPLHFRGHEKVGWCGSTIAILNLGDGLLLGVQIGCGVDCGRVVCRRRRLLVGCWRSHDAAAVAVAREESTG